eukprot:TRINITY_DN15791_c0_g1_i1.p1 TRINITY_DN15791_c0_g1~~TRINITY_DN15791_c0_g1_i1.p1  ORF type:complete len:242 (-),score=56.02 TRINITY_DN15791_c0_g1_i1:13-738(-)
MATPEVQRINQHFDRVLQNHYDPRITKLLQDYRKAETYPQNTERQEQVPRFVDCFGTRCAVAHLMEKTCPGIDVLALNKEFEYSRVAEIWQRNTAFRTWAASVHLNQEQLSEIQPSYEHWNRLDRSQRNNPPLYMDHIADLITDPLPARAPPAPPPPAPQPVRFDPFEESRWHAASAPRFDPFDDWQATPAPRVNQLPAQPPTQEQWQLVQRQNIEMQAELVRVHLKLDLILDALRQQKRV